MITARIAADFVEEYATLLELSGASPFRVRAYANAVRALEALTSPLDELLAAGTLTEVKGIGDSVAELGRRVGRHRHGPSLRKAVRRNARGSARHAADPRLGAAQNRRHPQGPRH